MTYAEGTAVSPERSRNEIERILTRYGVTEFVAGTTAGRGAVAFRAHDRQIRFILPLPAPDDPSFARTPTGQRRNARQAAVACDAETRRRWRALALVIKAKLEIVATGITTFEDEFAAQIVLPDGSTVGDHLSAQISHAYATGTIPPLIPGTGRAAIEA